MITALFNWVLMLLLLAVAGYAQYRLPYHTASRRQALLARGILIATGVAVGWVATAWQPAPGLGPERVAFVTGFGLVHVPAAFILWSKRVRGVYR